MAISWSAVICVCQVSNTKAMTRPLRIGLTGGIASGKSTVTQRFEELSVPVIDADTASRAVVGPGSIGLQQVVTRFGREVLGLDGELNRGALRAQVFADPASRKALEAILHPLIRAYMEQRAKEVVSPYLIMAIPLLVESGSPRERVDRILVVDVDEATQIDRLLARDGSSKDQAQAILYSQTSRETRLAAADDVLLNDGTVGELRQAVDRLHQQYLRLAHSP
jgi:dephospho-CoA kinase